MLAPDLPYPPHKGTALRNLHLLQGLSARHEVHLLSFAQGEAPEAKDFLLSYCAAVHTVPLPRRSLGQRLLALGFSSRPDLAWRLASEPFGAALEDLLDKERFDALQVEGLEMAPFYVALRDK